MFRCQLGIVELQIAPLPCAVEHSRQCSMQPARSGIQECLAQLRFALRLCREADFESDHFRAREKFVHGTAEFAEAFTDRTIAAVHNQPLANGLAAGFHHALEQAGLAAEMIVNSNL